MSDRLRVLQYITPSGIGGAELHVASLAEKLRERGHEVEIICPHGRPLLTELAARGLPARAPHTYGKFDPIMVGRLTWWLRRLRPDVLHTHLSTASLLGSAAARLAGFPAVATVHGLNTRTCFNWSSHVIAVSHAVKQYLVYQGLPEHRITVIHNGVDLKLLSRATTARRFAEPGGCPRGAGAGDGRAARAGQRPSRFAPRAGPPFPAARVARPASARSGRRRAAGAPPGRGGGPGPGRPRGLRRVSTRRATFRAGGRYLRAPLLARGAFPLGPGGDGPGEAGGRVPRGRNSGSGGRGRNRVARLPGQPEELIHALDYLLRNPQHAHAMGQAGARRVRDAFDLEQMVTRIEDIYRAMAKKG